MEDGQPIPYGSWQSPITSDLIVSGGIGLGLVGLDGDTVYWAEARPTEAGRVVIVRRASNGATSDVIPPPFNARTRVHEYGGGATLVAAGVVFFSNFTDQQLYRVRRGEKPQPLTTAAGMRYEAVATVGVAECIRDGPDIGPNVVKRHRLQRDDLWLRADQFADSLCDILEADRAHLALRLREDDRGRQAVQHVRVNPIHRESLGHDGLHLIIDRST